MPIALLLIVLTANLLAAPPSPAEKAPGRKETKSSGAKSTAKKSAPVAPPKDAERVDENTYRHTDAEGKSWTWRRTPFGWVKVPEDAPVKKVAAPEQPVRISVEGDTVHFERQTPFGSNKWSRKRNELNSWEKKVYQEWRDSNKTAAKEEK